MAREKKTARPRPGASGLEDSSTATSPASPPLLEAASQHEVVSEPAASQPSGSEAAASVDG
ncbi:hypothetical protein RchiOBHm_Chr1g0320071 [Rosa chinensis]|uniref:Uncharacterized protein n=1 Tax=Rosa chinensis TaxID=74649 RepID=A0A2P6S8N9_ROSCH|nr:hypothetical protein RchiOBHm_Chr1g0320071 [Rosa chinensis]